MSQLSEGLGGEKTSLRQPEVLAVESDKTLVQIPALPPAV